MKRKITAWILVAAATMGLMVGCGSKEAESTAATDDAAATESATEEAADAGGSKEGWPETLRIAQMPDEGNPDAGDSNDGFRTAMEEYLGIKVEEFEGAEYSVAIEAIKGDNLDVMLVSPMSYYQAKRVANVEPLVTTTVMGADPYKTVFITKSDRDDINSIEDLKGKTFAFVDPASSSGYMYPKAKLVTDLKLDPDQIENPDYFFKTVTYSGKHDSSLMGVTKGDYDAAAVALQTIGTMDEAGLINKDDIKIVGETEVIPNACYVMNANLPQDLKDKIKEFYLQYEDETYFELLYSDPKSRFVEAKDSDYDGIQEMVELLKIEE